MMKSDEIRSAFLEFFKSKGHIIVPSAPIVVKDDPTLMFTNAGMNPFKDYFLGNKQAQNTRVADTQKCLRVSGKHNDLEEVGIDTYHHTMFEMLGNWSFGDYFKKDAIEWAWELLTDVYKIDKNRLYVTVFEGFATENLAFDQESFDTWKPLIAEDRILNGSKKDNFWEMGDTGPCGPCTEIHVDLRPDSERQTIDGKTLVNNDHPQVIEIWNNVFMEFNRKADGSLEKLPAQHVDTGMGFERLVRVLQGKSSNYDTDIFQPLIKKMELDFKIKYGEKEETDIAFRVIADHIRAITFTIADGQLPSNNNAGYVIRRILRRAVRYGYTFLKMDAPYIHSLVAVLAQQFKDIFPEVIKQEDFIKKVILEEEKGFLATLAAGIHLLESYTGGWLSGKKLEPKFLVDFDKQIVAGEFAFQLYDTYGFPIDLTQLMAKENGWTVDMEGFQTCLQQQKTRSRNAAAKEEGDWLVLNDSKTATEFIGYDENEAAVSILRYRKSTQKGKENYHIVLDKTPFYPEGGGQVGDTGTLTSANETINIINTFRENDLIIHVSEALPEFPEEKFTASINTENRLNTARNHSATHLLHAALRMVLGTHVAQKGSLVNSKYLRFDFSHFAKMTDEEVRKVERIVNEKIRGNIPLHEDRNLPIDEAKKAGAMSLFGEKYGDKVRMITFDKNYSIELCGGTHIPATGTLGFFKITSEGAVAAGVRRIEALTGTEAENLIYKNAEEIASLKAVVKGNKPLIELVENLMEEKKQLEKQKEGREMADAMAKAERFIAEIIDNTDPIIKKRTDHLFSLDGDATRLYINAINANLKPAKTLLFHGKSQDGKAGIWLSIPKEETQKNKTLHAGNFIREIQPLIDGVGGGSPFYASVIGNNSKGLEEALKLIEEKLSLQIN
ncbi:MAG: alanine--tRNA ligase [Bacteroidetes bacterium]|nr:alanine--tRNA ligase [Bacteroidota bacterium]